MAKILVTGGAGFIGSHLVETLQAEGASVRVLDNLSTGSMDNLEQVQDRIDFVEGDLRDPGALQQALEDVAVVYHQAAFVSVPGSIEEPGVCLDINVTGTQQLLRFAEEAGVSRVVLASSSAVYGENSAFPLSEEAAPDILSPYAASKRVAEIYTQLFHRMTSLQVMALRYFNVYGPRQNADSDYAAVIPIFIRKLLEGKPPVVYGDGLQSRDFVFVKDVVRANLLAARVETPAHQVLNVCTGREFNLLEILNTLSGLISSSQPPVFQPARQGDIYRSVGDPELASDVLGFEACTSMEEGLIETIHWMQENDDDI